MDYYDKEVTCFCGKDFVWTVGEQEFMDTLYEQGKITSIIPPKRCSDCRLKKKQQREQLGY